MSEKCDDNNKSFVGMAKESQKNLSELEQQIDNLRAMGLGGTYKGVHQLATAYNTNDIVSRDGILYSSSVDNNTTVPPSVSWTLLIQPDSGYYTGEAS